MAPVLSLAALVPRVRATKLATAPGASFSNNCAVMVPIEVLMIQKSPGGRSGVGSSFLAGVVVFAGVVAAFLAGAGGAVWANAPIVIIKRKDSRFIGFSVTPHSML